MTLYKPTLFINAVGILKANQFAYLQKFHAGINVIHGENSSGKSTILNSLFYGLGGDFRDFNDDALKCDDVLVEVVVNGDTTVLLKRAITDKPRQAMDIAFASIDTWRDIPSEAWSRHPFIRTKERESFSQVLFRLIGFPEARGEVGSNLTMHQLLRLIYADQSSLQQRILRTETFDTVLIREAIGDFFYGAFDDELYNLIIDQESKQKEFLALDGQLKNLYVFLGKLQTDLSVMSVQAEQQRWAEKYAALQGELQMKAKEPVNGQPGATQADAQLLDSLSSEIEKTSSSLAVQKARQSTLVLAIGDSDSFVAELDERLRAVQESEAVQRLQGQFTFHYCPVCFAELKPIEPHNLCHLCKSPLDPEKAVSVARMANELVVQKRESAKLRELRAKELNELEPIITSQQQRLREAKQQYQRLRANWVSESETKVRLLHEEIGYAKRMMEGLSEKANLIELLSQIQNRKAELAGDLDTLKEKIEAKKHRVSQSKQEARLQVTNNLLELLHADLPRQEEFIKATQVDFDLAANTFAVNTSSYFSQSSTVFLNKCFRLAFFEASCQLSFMRFPRLLILDGIEDGGMELDRAYHFQNLVLDVSQKADISHQIILATSQISGELDDPTYTIGEAFSHDKRSLAIKQASS